MCPDFEWSTLSGFQMASGIQMVQTKDGRQTISLDHFIYINKLFSFYIKWSRLINHLNTGRFCPVFEWLICLDRFLYKETKVL